MARSRMTDVDHGAKRLLALVRDGNKLALKVGVFGDLAAQAAQGGGGLTVGELAAAHEFSIPAGQPRSWLRATLDEQGPTIVNGMSKLYKQVVGGSMQAREALKLTGLAIVGKIQLRIAAGIPPALAPSYLDRKLEQYPGATTPLIASGQFRQSITSDVVQVGDTK